MISKNVILMWDNLQKKDWIGPSVYIICRNAMESTAHLLLQYEYAVSVWANCMHSLNYLLVKI